VNRLGHHRFGSVGQPIPDVEVKIDVDGEILARGPNIMKGYWKQPERRPRPSTGRAGSTPAISACLTPRGSSILLTARRTCS